MHFTVLDYKYKFQFTNWIWGFWQYLEDMEGTAESAE